MADTSEYRPPKVWSWSKPSGGTFSSINRPVAGPTAVKRRRMVNRTSGELSEQLRERHDAGKFATRAQDNLAGQS